MNGSTELASLVHWLVRYMLARTQEYISVDAGCILLDWWSLVYPAPLSWVIPTGGRRELLNGGRVISLSIFQSDDNESYNFLAHFPIILKFSK